MAQHEQPDQPKYDDLAKQIREAGMAVDAKTAHAGMESVPEEVRERPHREFDTPLDQAVVEGKVDELPNHLGEIEPHEDDDVTRARHIAKKTAEAAPATPNHRRRNLIIGTTLAGTALGAVLYAGGFGRSHDTQADPTGPNQQPVPTATANTGHNKTSVKEHQAAPAPLDASIDSSIVPLTDNQLNELKYKNWPNNVEQALGANLDPNAVTSFVREGSFQKILDSMPNWDGAYAMHQTYAQRGILETLGNRPILNDIYNNDYAGMSGAYGEAQSLFSPEAAKFIGSAPVIKISDLESAAANSDFTSVWNKLYPDSRDLGKALLTELKAGNNDPSMVDRLTAIAMVGNEIQGNLNSPMDSQTRDAVESTYHDTFQNLYDEYQKDPKKAETDFAATDSAKTTTQLAFAVEGVRQFPGLDVQAESGGKSTVSSFVIYRQYSVEGSPRSVDDGQYGELSLITFVAAPTKDGKNQYAMPILLDQTSTKLPTAQ